MLGTVFGRSLMTFTQRGPLPAGPDDVGYVFAHETLSAVAREKLGNDLRDYRRRIDGWADGYRERGWPAETPLYLLWPYGKLLGDEGNGDLRRLADLATDPLRHDRLLAATLGDGDAIAELAAAQKLALQQQARRTWRPWDGSRSTVTAWRAATRTCRSSCPGSWSASGSAAGVRRSPRPCPPTGSPRRSPPSPPPSPTPAGGNGR